MERIGMNKTGETKSLLEIWVTFNNSKLYIFYCLQPRRWTDTYIFYQEEREFY